MTVALEPTQEKLLSTQEAASLLKMRRNAVLTLLHRRKLHGQKVLGKVWGIPLSEIERYLIERKPRGRPKRIG